MIESFTFQSQEDLSRKEIELLEKRFRKTEKTDSKDLLLMEYYVVTSRAEFSFGGSSVYILVCNRN